MARWKDVDETKRELLEADLGRLGHALVFLHLVLDRVRAASIVDGQDVLLEPAVEDCRQIERLIREVQCSIIDKFKDQ